MTLKTVKRLTYIQKELTSQKLVDVGFPVFVNETPIRSGNARRKTSKDSDEIKALYPYAVKLDQGYSTESPNGMTKPTIKAIRDYVRRTLGR